MSLPGTRETITDHKTKSGEEWRGGIDQLLFRASIVLVISRHWRITHEPQR